MFLILICSLNHLDCQQCESYFTGYCPHYGPVFPIVENPIQDTSNNLYSKSIPDGVDIRETSSHGSRPGVYATAKFSLGTRFGPYEGEELDYSFLKERGASHMWEVGKLWQLFSLVTIN